MISPKGIDKRNKTQCILPTLLRHTFTPRFRSTLPHNDSAPRFCATHQCHASALASAPRFCARLSRHASVSRLRHTFVPGFCASLLRYAFAPRFFATLLCHASAPSFCSTLLVVVEKKTVWCFVDVQRLLSGRRKKTVWCLVDVQRLFSGRQKKTVWCLVDVQRLLCGCHT